MYQCQKLLVLKTDISEHVQSTGTVRTHISIQCNHQTFIEQSTEMS
jgi:hypothetical protein